MPPSKRKEPVRPTQKVDHPEPVPKSQVFYKRGFTKFAPTLPQDLKECDSDPINHPSHYSDNDDSGIECVDAIEAALGPRGFTAFLRGQVIKYTWRMGKKDSTLNDALKCQWYQNKLVETLQDAGQ